MTTSTFTNIICTASSAVARKKSLVLFNRPYPLIVKFDLIRQLRVSWNSSLFDVMSGVHHGPWVRGANSHWRRRAWIGTPTRRASSSGRLVTWQGGAQRIRSATGVAPCGRFTLVKYLKLTDKDAHGQRALQSMTLLMTLDVHRKSKRRRRQLQSTRGLHTGSATQL